MSAEGYIIIVRKPFIPSFILFPFNVNWIIEIHNRIYLIFASKFVKKIELQAFWLIEFMSNSPGLSLIRTHGRSGA